MRNSRLYSEEKRRRSMSFSRFRFLQHLPQFLLCHDNLIISIEVVKIEPKISVPNRRSVRVYFSWKVDHPVILRRRNIQVEKWKVFFLQKVSQEGKRKALSLKMKNFTIFYPQKSFRVISEEFDFGFSFEISPFEPVKYFKGLLFQVKMSSNKEEFEIFHPDFLFINDFKTTIISPSKSVVNNQPAISTRQELLLLLKMIPSCEKFKTELNRTKTHFQEVQSAIQETITFNCDQRCARHDIQKLFQIRFENKKENFPFSHIPRYNVIHENLIRKHSQNLIRPGKKNEKLRLEAIRFFADIIIPQDKRRMNITIAKSESDKPKIYLWRGDETFDSFLPINTGIELDILEKYDVLRNILVATFCQDKERNTDKEVGENVKLRFLKGEKEVQKRSHYFDQFNNLTIFFSKKFSNNDLFFCDYREESLPPIFFHVESFQRECYEVLRRFILRAVDLKEARIIHPSREYPRLQPTLLYAAKGIDLVMRRSGGFDFMIDYFLYHSRKMKKDKEYVYSLEHSESDRRNLGFLLYCFVYPSTPSEMKQILKRSFEKWFFSSRFSGRKLEELTTAFLFGQLQMIITKITKMGSKSSGNKLSVFDISKPPKHSFMNSLRKYSLDPKNLKSIFYSMSGTRPIRFGKEAENAIREVIDIFEENEGDQISTLHHTSAIVIGSIHSVVQGYYLNEKILSNPRYQQSKLEELFILLTPKCLHLISFMTSLQNTDLFDSRSAGLVSRCLKLLEMLVQNINISKNQPNYQVLTNFFAEIFKNLVKTLRYYIQEEVRVRKIEEQFYKSLEEMFLDLRNEVVAKPLGMTFEEFTVAVSSKEVLRVSLFVSYKSVAKLLEELYKFFLEDYNEESEGIENMELFEEIVWDIHTLKDPRLDSLNDVVSGILRMFNLICIEKDPEKYPLDTFDRSAFFQRIIPRKTRLEVFNLISQIRIIGIGIIQVPENEMELNKVHEMMKKKFNEDHKASYLLVYSNIQHFLLETFDLDGDHDIGHDIAVLRYDYLTNLMFKIHDLFGEMGAKVEKFVRDEFEKISPSKVKTWSRSMFSNILLRAKSMNSIDSFMARDELVKIYFKNWYSIFTRKHLRDFGNISEFVSLVLYGNKKMETDVYDKILGWKKKRVSISEEYVYVKREYESLGEEEKRKMDGVDVSKMKFGSDESKTSLFQFFIGSIPDFENYYRFFLKMIETFCVYENYRVALLEKVKVGDEGKMNSKHLSWDISGIDSWCFNCSEYRGERGIEIVDMVTTKFVFLEETVKETGIALKILDDKVLFLLILLILFGYKERLLVVCEKENNLDLFFRDFWSKIEEKKCEMQEKVRRGESLENVSLLSIRSVYEELAKKVEFLFDKFSIIRKRQKIVEETRKKDKNRKN